MKYSALPVLVATLLVGCCAGKTEFVKPTVEAPPTAPSTIRLTEADALRIAKQFAEKNTWEIERIPTRARFGDFGTLQDKWQVWFKIKNRGGPFIVYVDDSTGDVLFIVGE